jgi:hypothetical protein
MTPSIFARYDPALPDKSAELQTEIDRLSETLCVRPVPVEFRTHNGLNIYVADTGDATWDSMTAGRSDRVAGR